MSSQLPDFSIWTLAGFPDTWDGSSTSIPDVIPDTVPFMIYVLDLKSRKTVYVNRQLNVMLGYPEGTFTDLGRDFLTHLLHPADKSAIRRRTEEWGFAPDDEHREIEYRLKHANGEWRWFVSRTKVFARGADGAPTHIIGCGEDITERKRALDASDQRFRLLAENLPGVVFICKMDARYTPVYLNDEIERATGYPKEDFYAGRISFSELHHRRDGAAVLKQIEDAVNSHRPFHVTYRLKHRNGEWRWFQEFGAGVNDEKGDLAYIEGFFYDVSERKRREDEQQRLSEQMQHTQKLESLGLLAGGIAHDFNNLLMGVLGNAVMAREDLPEGAPAREALIDIEDSARRASALCNQLLAYSGKGKFVVEPLDLSKLVRQMAHLLEVSISKKASLVMNCADGLPAIDADTSQVQQIVMNLIINASDSFERGAGKIAVTTRSIYCDAASLAKTYMAHNLAPGRYVSLEVEDTGPGMDAATRERMFDPFFTTKFTGRGLGLAAVLGIVNGHGGAIRVDSALGAGTRFQVLFPASDRLVAEPERPEETPFDWEGEGLVLVVDDDARVLSLARKMLERAGFRVLTASDGREGVLRFDEQPDDFRLVLLDLTMPGLSGHEAIAAMRARRRDIPVILISGYGEPDSKQRFAKNGRTRFLQKPFTGPELYRVVRRMLADVDLRRI